MVALRNCHTVKQSMTTKLLSHPTENWVRGVTQKLAHYLSLRCHLKLKCQVCHLCYHTICIDTYIQGSVLFPVLVPKLFADIMLNASSWKKYTIFWKNLLWKVFLSFSLTGQYWLRRWLGGEQVPSHYLHKWWLNHACTPIARYMGPTSRAVNVQLLQPEIALCNYQNTVYSSRRTSNLLQNHKDLTNVPHKIMFHDTWCNGCNVFVSLHDSKNTILGPSN